MTVSILKDAFGIIKSRWKELLLVYAVVWLPVYIAVSMFNDMHPFTDFEKWRNRMIISGLFYPVIQAAVYHVVFTVKNGERSRPWRSLLFGIQKWIPIIIAGIIADFIVTVSLLAFIVPGVFFAVRYSFLPCVVCFQEYRKDTARMISFRMTRRWFWTILRTVLVCAVMSGAVTIAIVMIPVPEAGNIHSVYQSCVDFASDITWILPDIAIVLLYMKRHAGIEEESEGDGEKNPET
ncbi:MAG: hypothetical protein ACOC2H_01685 [Spirochaetota bacterium]